MKISITVLAVLFFVSFVNSQETEVKKWKDTAELSYVKTSGNSKTATISAKNTFNYDWTKSALELSAGGLGTKSANSVTAEQYNASEKLSFKFSGKNYAFQKNSWNKDRFAGIKDRFDLSAGLGREIISLKNDKLFTELGAGYIFEDRIYSDNKSFGAYNALAKYQRTLSPTANFSQTAEYLGNLKDSAGYRFNAESALISSISTNFSLKASYLLKYSNQPSTGFKKTDSTTAIAIIVNY